MAAKDPKPKKKDMRGRKYSVEQKTEALIHLAINGYDYQKTAEELGISVGALYGWNLEPIKNTIPELLERALKMILVQVPDNIPASEWAKTVGILVDKWLIFQGFVDDDGEREIGRIVRGMDDDTYEGTVDAIEKFLNGS